MHLCASVTGTTLRGCPSYNHSSPMSHTAATARTGREYNGCWKTGNTPLGQPMMVPTAGWPTNTLSHDEPLGRLLRADPEEW